MRAVRDVMVLAPPLVISEAEIDEIALRARRALDRTAADLGRAAFHLLARSEGILAALESSHAIAQAIKLAREYPKDALILVNLSGRGDKDIFTIAKREAIAL